MTEIKDEIFALISKSWVWIMYITLGIVGKLSNDIRNGTKLGWGATFASIGIAIFCGGVSSWVCYTNQWDKVGMFIVPVVTLVSDQIVKALFAIDWNTWLNDWLDMVKKNIKKN
jgi:hypothetical protein